MLKILISDDNEMIKNIIESAVDKMDLEKEIFTAKNFDEELQIIDEFKPHLVITDIAKENRYSKGGFDIIQKYNNTNKSPIFIIVSGYNMHYEIEQNNIKNVWKCFQKPFRTEDLVKEIYNIDKKLNSVDLQVV